MIKATFRHNRIVDGQKYHEGKTYEMDDSFAGHAYFLALVNNKEVTVISDTKLSNHHAFAGGKKLLSMVRDAPEFLEKKEEESKPAEDSSDDEKPAQPNRNTRKG